jgi:hypothetical protein
MTTCRSCGAKVEWVETANGKKMPMDLEPDAEGNRISHFATCPQANDWRKR